MAGVKKALVDINDGMELLNSIIPGAFAAYKILRLIWQRDKPEMTFSEYNARLLKESSGVSVFSQEWFAEHGYTKVDGTWTKAAPEAVD
jgi:hypothetical protein